MRWARGAAGARRRAEFAARHHPPTVRSARGRSAVTIQRACLGARRVTIHRPSPPTVSGHHPPTCGTSPSADRTLGARPRSGHHLTGVLRRAAHHHPPAFARTDFRCPRIGCLALIRFRMRFGSNFRTVECSDSSSEDNNSTN